MYQLQSGIRYIYSEQKNHKNDIISKCVKLFLQYESLQIQWVERLSEVQHRATEAILKETENLKAVADANLRKAVSKINV